MEETSANQPPSLLRPALGTLVFAMGFAAPIIVLVPWSLAGWRLREPLLGGEASRWVGAALFLGGLPVWTSAAARFVRQGRGTPAPVAPPRRLVVTGPYRYVRNPMYVAVLAMVFGQALYLGSRAALGFGAFLAFGFHTFVLIHEEPTLRRRFGDDYAAYCRRVHRWCPRLTPLAEDPAE